MKCPVCRGTVKKGTTSFSVELKTGLLLIKDVPADVCGQCGESFFSDAVAEKLERIVERAKQDRVEVEIISYKMAA